MTAEEIVTQIDERLVAAAREIAQLEQARSALVDQSPPRRSHPVTRRRRRSITATPARSATRFAELTRLLEDSPVITTRELASRTGGTSGRILHVLKEHERTGAVRRSGARATTRWHLVTDEERIAARAAQLRKASSSS